jgi:hypothetical protein
MHRSRRALFECKSHFRINTRSPMLLWDGCSSALESETHPKFNVFKLTPPRDAIPAAGPD